MKKSIFLILGISIIISCNNSDTKTTVKKEKTIIKKELKKVAPKKEVVKKMPQTFNFDSVKYKYSFLDSISSNFISDHSSDKYKCFYKLNLKEIERLFGAQIASGYNEIDYSGIHLVSKKNIINNMSTLIVFYWRDCVYKGDLLTIQNDVIVDKIEVFSSLSCASTGNSYNDTTLIDIKKEKFTLFSDSVSFKVTEVLKRKLRVDSDNEVIVEIDSTIHNYIIQDNGKILNN